MFCVYWVSTGLPAIARHCLLLTMFHLAISNMAQRHVAFCERHGTLYVRHVVLHVRHVALQVRHVAFLIFRQ